MNKKLIGFLLVLILASEGTIEAASMETAVSEQAAPAPL